jgi:hypothetical protein
MPYIKNDRRKTLAEYEEFPRDAGELNFCFTKIINHYIAAHGLRYAQINDIVGALEGAKLEFYRRVAAPYEDKKILENGDVYP